MSERESASVEGRFFRRRNQEGSDFFVNLVTCQSGRELPPAVQNQGKFAHGFIFTVTGYNLPTVKELKYRYYGSWVMSPKYGLQFEAKSCREIPPDTRSGIATYLASSRFHGIGKASARAIVDRFGLETLEVVRNTPEQLLEVRGVTRSRLASLLKSFHETESYGELAAFLGAFRIRSDRIAKIYECWGQSSEARIRENPYALTEISGISFSDADLIAHELQFPEDSRERIRAGILAVLAQDTAEGNLWMDLRELKKRTEEMLNESFGNQAVNEAMVEDELIHAEDAGELVRHGGCAVFLKENEEAEHFTAEKLLELLAVSPEASEETYAQALEHVLLKQESIHLAEGQKKGVMNCLTHRVSILTGGPGTGKTTVLSAIIQVYQKVTHGQVTLLAPTGKAARRMSEQTGIPASTIHSAIHLYQSDLKTGECVTLPEGLIIVDEMSMVDQFVMAKMMACIRNVRESHLVLVGDADQLPSVAAGDVLSECIASGVIPTVKLTEVFRQGRDAEIIRDNAARINEGNTELYVNDRFEFIPASDEEAAVHAIQEVYRKELERWGPGNAVVLCPRRSKCTVSVDLLNPKLQDIVNPRVSGEPVVTISGTEFRIRDRVVQMKNTAQASNGDIGVLTDIRFEKNADGENETVFTIRWENGAETEYMREDMISVELAYALTIHKSQGAEAPSVIIPVLNSQRYMLHRNLLYTGVTRASQKVTLIGERDAIDVCIQNSEKGRRTTLLSERLKFQYQKITCRS